MREHDIKMLIAGDPWMMNVLRRVRELNLPDSCVCAGFVRSKIWDILHGFHSPTPLQDVDVVYYDAKDTRESAERGYERVLQEMDSTIPWSVKNQARMHEKSGFLPFVSTIDGIAHFTETCTAVGTYMDAEGDIHIIAPHGLDDLSNLIVKPTPYFLSPEKIHIYRDRIQSKQWQVQWHLLRLEWE